MANIILKKIFPSIWYVCVCVCVCVGVCMCVCVRSATMKASSIMINWNAREQIKNDVFLSSSKFLYHYFWNEAPNFPN